MSVPLRIWLLLLTVSVAGCSTNMIPPKNSSSKEASPYWMWYSLQLGETESNSLTVDEQGGVSAKIEDADIGSAPRALGWFHLPLTSEDPDVQCIGEIIRNSGLTALPVKEREPTFGMKSKLFYIRSGGREARHNFDPAAPMPPGFADVEQAVERLFSRLQKGPLRTLAIDVSFQPDKVAPGQEFRVVMEFHNAGKFAAEIRNPAAFKTGGGNSMRLNCFRPMGNDAGSVEDEYEFSFDLSEREFLIAERKALESGEIYLRLDPGQKLRVWVTQKCPNVPAAIYTVETSYSAVAVGAEEQKKHNDLIAGSYTADLRKLTIGTK